MVQAAALPLPLAPCHLRARRAAAVCRELTGKRAEWGRRLVSTGSGQAVCAAGPGFGGVSGRQVLGGSAQSPFV